MPSITRRLTSWYAGILLFLLLLNGGAAYLGMSYLLYKEAKREVITAISTIQGLAGPENENLDTPEIISTMRSNIFWIQITTPNGSVLNHSANIGSIAFAPNYVGHSVIRKIRRQEVIIAGAEIHRGIQVQIARPLEKEKDFLDNLAGVLLGLAIIVLFFALAGGRMITKTALEPIKRLTHTARRISSTDLSRRIELVGPRDELYTLAETFNQMLSRVEKGYQSQQEFLLAASHDLRTPLAIIKSYTDVLNRWGKNEPDVVDESLLAIDKAVKVMDRLVNDLLVLARMQTKPELKPVPIDLGELVEEITTEAKSISGDINIIFEQLDLARVEVDEHYIRRAIWALLDNAIKYNHPFGEVVVSVNADISKHEAIISIQDTGPGIEEEELPKLFERFYRGDPSRNQTKGFGLGLALVKEIVEAHEGRVAVESQVGQGSCFEIILPLNL